jgi:thiosulfate/3-mercaptopyruvate sulfurtransferase
LKFRNKLRLFFFKLFCILFFISISISNANAETKYNFQNLFITATWAQENKDRIVFIDARSAKNYRKGHIPGAVSAPWQMFTYMDGNPEDPGWGNLLTKEELAAKLAGLGINGENFLVVYANTPGWGEDGRFLWMALLLGIKKIKILDGGISSWKKNGGEMTREKTSLPITVFKLNQWNETMLASIKWMQSNQGKVKIIDARSKREFNGAVKYNEARGGHLPGAILIPFRTLFKPDGTIKKTPQLKEIFQSKGLKSDNEIAVYCTAGIRAAYMTLILRMAGFEKARNYDGSLYEWSATKHLPLL